MIDIELETVGGAHLTWEMSYSLTIFAERTQETLMRLTTVGIGFVVVGIAIFVFTLVRLINGSALDPQAKVPGTITVEIHAPGRYYIWDNYGTMFDGKRVQYAPDCPDDANVIIREANGTELQFVPDASQSWSIGNNAKASIGYVDVSTATTIRLDIDGVGRERIITVSDRSMKQELWSRLGGFGVGLIVGAFGVTICLLGLLVRRRDSAAAGESAAANNG